MRDADVDRLLTAWLTDGPARVPDGAVETAIAHARLHAPKRSRAFVRGSVMETLGLRDAPRRRLAPVLLWTALGALLVLVVGGALVAGGWLRLAPPPDVPPTLPAVVPPAPTASPSPAPETPIPTRPAPSGPLPTPFAAAQGHIAYTVDGDVRVLDVATGDTRTLVEGPEVERVGGWSPDGRLLAYWVRVADDAGQAGMAMVAHDLWTVAADGDDHTLVMDAGDPGGWPLWQHLGVSWAGDGSRLAVTHFIGWAVTATRLVELDGGAREIPLVPILHDPEQGTADPAISPDGTRVAMGRGASHGYLAAGIMIASADPGATDEPRTLDSTLEVGQLAPESISWLDDSALAFVAGDALWSVNADGSALARLTPLDWSVRRALAAPDGTAIALVATTDADPIPRTYVISTGGTSTASGALFPAWVVRGDAEACAGETRLSAAPLAWSPDGHHVAFLAATPDRFGCRLAWMPAQTPETLVERWHTPDFFYPYVWESPVVVTPTLLDGAVDEAPIAWGR